MIGTIAIGATTMFCQKITFQDRYSVNQPATDSATDGEIVVMQAYIAMPQTRCCSGVNRSTHISSSGSSAPAPQPCRKRNRTMIGYGGTAPSSAALAVVSTTLATSIRRGEKMPVSQGVAGTTAMLPTANAVLIQPLRSTSSPTPPRRSATPNVVRRVFIGDITPATSAPNRPNTRRAVSGGGPGRGTGRPSGLLATSSGGPSAASSRLTVAMPVPTPAQAQAQAQAAVLPAAPRCPRRLPPTAREACG